MAHSIGIDLGTTFSAAARINTDGQPVIVPNSLGEAITPSVIWFGSDPPTVGQLAKNEQRAGATDVAAFFKRSMGDSNFVLSFHGRDYTPIDLSALVLKQIRSDCEVAMGGAVEQAVITVPAYFNNAQREATIEAGRRADLKVLRIINEPTAAALAYGVHRSGGTETTLVYDLGGGTFDVTLVRIAPDRIDVLGTDGDHELGGKDWDDRVASYLATRFRDEYGRDPLEDTVAFNDLLVRCEDAKKKLTDRAAVPITIDHGGVRGSYELTREKLEELTADLMERTRKLTEQVLTDAGVGWSNLSGVLLVGGSTRMPMVHEYVCQMSGQPPRTGVHVDQAVALGAAIQAALDVQAAAPWSAPRYKLAGAKAVQDVMSHSLGIVVEAPDRSRYVNSIIIQKNQPIPASMKRPYQLRTRSRGENVLEVYVTQGESETPSSCSFLGKYRFSDITHVPGRDAAVIEIKYDYDRNGVVAVSAVDRSTGKSLAMTVEPIPQDMAWLSQPPAQAVVQSHATAYLAFDLSGSMSGAPLAEAQTAARAFVQQSDLAHCSLGVISFADSVKTTATACQDAKKLNRAISGMAIGDVGGGNDASPFAHTHQLLAGVDDPRYIVVLTDGVWSDQPRAVREAHACHKDGIEIIAIGFGGADRAFLQRIANSAEGSFLTSLGKLVETFSTIAQAITEGGGQLRPKAR